MDFAYGISSLSTCRRATVGAVICSPDFTEVFAVGYNGPPRGTANDSCTDVTGNCGCVHAETNALLKLADKRDAILICTKTPCFMCSGHIINTPQIKQVIFDQEYRDLHDRLKEMNIDNIRQWCPTYSGP